MEIKYLNKMKEEPSFAGYKIEGLNIQEIEKLETIYNKGEIFPKSFREYLYLGGKKGGTGVVDNDFKELHFDCQEDLKRFNYKVERPYFVFDNYDSQYSIFFLDEEFEDPKIYILDPYGKNRGEYDLIRPGFIVTFSKLINEAIYRIKNDIPF